MRVMWCVYAHRNKKKVILDNLELEKQEFCVFVRCMAMRFICRRMFFVDAINFNVMHVVDWCSVFSQIIFVQSRVGTHFNFGKKNFFWVRIKFYYTHNTSYAHAGQYIYIGFENECLVSYVWNEFDNVALQI